MNNKLQYWIELNSVKLFYKNIENNERFFDNIPHCEGGGVIVSNFLGNQGLATIILTGAYLGSQRIFCLDVGDDFDFYHYTRYQKQPVNILFDFFSLSHYRFKKWSVHILLGSKITRTNKHLNFKIRWLNQKQTSYETFVYYSRH